MKPIKTKIKNFEHKLFDINLDEVRDLAKQQMFNILFQNSNFATSATLGTLNRSYETA